MPVPLGPEMNHVGEKSLDPLTVLAYPAEGSGETMLYEDSGEGYDYRTGEYARRSLSCEKAGGHISVRLGNREGNFTPERERVMLELRASRVARRACGPEARSRSGAMRPASCTSLCAKARRR